MYKFLMKFLIQNKFFKSILKYQKYVLISFFVILIIGLFEALVLSPQDYLQGDSVRIMYVHVPSAWLALGIFSIISILSVLVFIFKNKNLVLIAKSLAPSGFIFNIIALVTGSIWGRPTWGTWWAMGCTYNFNAYFRIILFDVLISLEDISK